MKRTTIYLEPELEVLLKTEMVRRRQTMAEIVREAVYAYVTREPRRAPPGAGQFASGRADTAEDADAALEQTGFARADGPKPPGGGSRPPRRRPRTSGRARTRDRR